MQKNECPTPPIPNAAPLPAARPRHRLEYAAMALLLLVLAVAWSAWLGRPDFPLDDAYIVQHSIQGLFSGHETRFAGSTPMQGVTSPAHIMLVSALALAAPVPWAQLLAIVCAAMLYILGIMRFSFNEGTPSFWTWLLAALPLVAGYSPLHLLNGLETGLAMAAIIWVLVLFRDPFPARVWHFALLGALPFIRPELGAFGFLLWLRAMLGLPGPGRLRLGLLASAWALAGTLPFMAFLGAFNAPLLPNTMSAKTYFFAEGCQAFGWKLRFASYGLINFLCSFGIAALGLLALAFCPFRGVALAFSALFFAAYAVRFPGALFHNHYRYPYMLTPLFVAGWASWIASPRKYVRHAGRALLLAAAAWAAAHAYRGVQDYLFGIDVSRIELAGVSNWVAKHVPPTAPVLVHDAGYISLAGPQPLVDLVGLKTPSSVEIHRRLTWAEKGIRSPRALDAIAQKNGVQYFVVFNDWDKDFRLTRALLLAGWDLERADAERGNTIYRVYRLTPPWLQAAESFPAVDMLRVYCGWPYR